MGIKLITNKVNITDIQKIADEQFSGELVKAVVDIEKNIIAVGGSMHADEEAFLLENGSNQMNLWGINIRPNDADPIEFDSMINIRPNQGNRSRTVEDKDIQQQIRLIVFDLIDGLAK